MVLAHEMMHVLLNAKHREDPKTALFFGEATDGKPVTGPKRIGPYPDAAKVGNRDTTTIRRTAENFA